MTSSIESFDKAIISRQPNFNLRKTRSKFRKVIPNLKTVVVHCFDPRVTGGIPPAVAKALPDQIYPGEVFEFVGEDGKKNIGTNTTIFPVVVAGGRASGSAQRSISSPSGNTAPQQKNPPAIVNRAGDARQRPEADHGAAP